ncbi:MAG: pyridoxamine 5'-phosphate oxidase family protein, partial [Actinomycetota bacterium]
PAPTGPGSHNDQGAGSGAKAGFYHEGSRSLQDRFGTRRLADRIDEVHVHDRITDADRAFIERMDTFFVATADEKGRPTCSHKGGGPGFVRVVDEHTIAFPSYDGNGMFLTTGNVLRNPHVGLLFVDFERAHRMRLNGVAGIDFDDELLTEYPGAQFVVRVRAREVFPNCPRYIHRRTLVERSRFVPRSGSPAPEPDWKREPWAREALGDPGA